MSKNKVFKQINNYDFMPDLGMNLGNYQKLLTFDKKEIINLIIGAVIMGFIAGFTKWGQGKIVDFRYGLNNLLIYTTISLIILFFFAISTKIIAIKKGYIVTYSLSMPMIITSLVLAFLTYGTLWFFPVASIQVEHNKKLRLGFFRFQFNLKEQSMIAFFGPFTILCIAFLFKSFGMATNFILLDKEWMIEILKIAVLFSVQIMLPLPGLNGLLIFFERPGKYFLFFGLIIGLAISVFFIDNFLISILVAIVFSLLFFVVGNKLMDKL